MGLQHWLQAAFSVVQSATPLVANAGGPYSGKVGQPISFDGSKSTGPSAQTLNYTWNFGDSSTGTGVNPTHSYSAAGSFTVALAVTDAGGESNTATTTATIANVPVLTKLNPNSGPQGQQN